MISLCRAISAASVEMLRVFAMSCGVGGFSVEDSIREDCMSGGITFVDRWDG